MLLKQRLDRIRTDEDVIKPKQVDKTRLDQWAVGQVGLGNALSIQNKMKGSRYEHVMGDDGPQSNRVADAVKESGEACTH